MVSRERPIHSFNASRVVIAAVATAMRRHISMVLAVDDDKQ